MYAVRTRRHVTFQQNQGDQGVRRSRWSPAGEGVLGCMRRNTVCEAVGRLRPPSDAESHEYHDFHENEEWVTPKQPQSYVDETRNTPARPCDGGCARPWNGARTPTTEHEVCLLLKRP